MFKVLGIDQKEYGPVSADVVHRWVREGRANARTQVQAQGATDWKPIAEFPEFAEALAGGGRPPPLVSPAGTAPGRLPSLTSRAPSPETSGMAIGALICGILGLCSGVTALAGLPLGIAAVKKINRSGGRLTGKGLAIAGISLSSLALLILLALIVGVVLPELARERTRARSATCMNNLRQLGMAMRMYANDQSDRFARASNWCDALQGYVGSPPPFTCGAAAPGQRSHFGFNASLSGMESVRVNPRTVLFFEIDGGWNVSGGAEKLLRRPRHGGVNVCYADGTVEQVYPGRLSQLRWNP
jgi:hypothetical protein